MLWANQTIIFQWKTIHLGASDQLAFVNLSPQEIKEYQKYENWSACCDTAGMSISHGSSTVWQSCFLILLLNLKSLVPLKTGYDIYMNTQAVHLVCKQLENRYNSSRWRSEISQICVPVWLRGHLPLCKEGPSRCSAALCPGGLGTSCWFGRAMSPGLCAEPLPETGDNQNYRTHTQQLAPQQQAAVAPLCNGKWSHVCPSSPWAPCSVMRSHQLSYWSLCLSVKLTENTHKVNGLRDLSPVKT